MTGVNLMGAVGVCSPQPIVLKKKKKEITINTVFSFISNDEIKIILLIALIISSFFLSIYHSIIIKLLS